MPPKSLFASRTFWLAVLQAMAGAVVIFTTTYPEVGWLLQLKSLLDILLRLLTRQSVRVG